MGRSLLEYMYTFIYIYIYIYIYANKISHIARHVAIKNKILRLSHMKALSDNKIEAFLQDMSRRTHVGANILDAAICL